MTTSDLLEYINQKPFRPFTIATTDGKRFQINHELDLAIDKRKKRSPRVVFLDPAGVIYVLEPEQIC